MTTRNRWLLLISAAAVGTVAQGGCVATEVIETIALAFSIVDVWV